MKKKEGAKKQQRKQNGTQKKDCAMYEFLVFKTNKNHKVIFRIRRVTTIIDGTLCIFHK